MENAYLNMLASGLSQLRPVLPFLIFAFVFVTALKLLEWKLGKRGRRWRNSSQWDGRRANVRNFRPNAVPMPDRVPDAADQLRTVMRAEFTPQRLLNKGEARLFRVLDQLVIELAPPGWQVMAQVSLGEILRCKDADAYRCVNSKRVDLLIVDGESRPLQAIEYQGGGHYKGAHATAARDAVKKEALRRAGIGYEEVVAGNHTPAELRRVVERLVSSTSPQ